jgi:hypothetical protein
LIGLSPVWITNSSQAIPRDGEDESVTVTPTLVGIPSTRKEDTTVTFVTNLQVSDSTKSARGRARRVMGRYARRREIENSSNSIKDLLAWTTSRNTVVRVFDVGFTVILDDMW